MSEKISKQTKKQVISELTIPEMLEIVREVASIRTDKKDKLQPRDFYLKRDLERLLGGDRVKMFENASMLGKIVFDSLPIIDGADDELRKINGYTDTLTAKEFSDWTKNTSGVAEMFKTLEVTAIELVTKAFPDPRAVQNKAVKGIIYGLMKEKEKEEKAAKRAKELEEKEKKEEETAQTEQTNTKQNDTPAT